MRIAVVHSFYTSANPSGENIVVQQQVEQLLAAGHDVLPIFRFTDEQQLRPDYALRAAAAVSSGTGPSPSKELEAFHPDVVHLHNTFPNFGTRWLDTWGRLTVATLHNYRTVCAAGTLFRDGHRCEDCLRTPALPAVRHRCYRDSRAATLPVAIGTTSIGGLHRILRRGARLVTLNEEMRGVLSRSSGRNIEVVPNFVAAAADQPVTGGWAFIGRLSAEKGIAELLNVWPDDEKLHVYGDGPLAPQLVSVFASRKNVQFHGPQPRSEILRVLGRFEGVVMPSMCQEGLPTVLLESLAAGVPLAVSSHVTALPELLERGVASTLCLDHPDAVRRALTQIRAGGEPMRGLCRETHAAQYSPETWLKRMLAVYDSIARTA